MKSHPLCHFDTRKNLEIKKGFNDTHKIFSYGLLEDFID